MHPGCVIGMADCITHAYESTLERRAAADEASATRKVASPSICNHAHQIVGTPDATVTRLRSIRPSSRLWRQVRSGMTKDRRT